MQVEYEASSSMPPPPAVRPSEEEEEEEEVEGEEGGQDTEAGPLKKKPKRIIKQRQSLLEKERGTLVFPMTRIKKIVRADEELSMMSTEACFLVGVATHLKGILEYLEKKMSKGLLAANWENDISEGNGDHQDGLEADILDGQEFFIKHFVEEGYVKARLENRKIVNYKDMAIVVAKSEEFDFLKDVIPMPTPLSQALASRKAKIAADDNPTLYEDEAPSTSNNLKLDDLPPLQPSSNPLFPNAIVKRPPNTHSKGYSAARKAAVNGAPVEVVEKAASTRGRGRPKKGLPDEGDGAEGGDDGVELGSEGHGTNGVVDEQMEED